jgi:hypothetical protein
LVSINLVRPHHRLGIFTGLDMRNQTLEFMNGNFGKSGAYYYWISRGVDERPVRAQPDPKVYRGGKHVRGRSNRIRPMEAELKPLIDKVWLHCESTGTRGRMVTLKVKFADFGIITRSRSVSSAVANRNDLAELATSLLKDNMPLPKRCASWGSRCLSCKAGTTRSRNWISGFEPTGASIHHTAVAQSVRMSAVALRGGTKADLTRCRGWATSGPNAISKPALNLRIRFRSWATSTQTRLRPRQ